MEKESEERKAAIATRRQRKIFDSMTKRKKLGRGKFQPYEEPVLLPTELTGSLRTLPARGNLIEGTFFNSFENS